MFCKNSHRPNLVKLKYYLSDFSKTVYSDRKISKLAIYLYKDLDKCF